MSAYRLPNPTAGYQLTDPRQNRRFRRLLRLDQSGPLAIRALYMWIQFHTRGRRRNRILTLLIHQFRAQEQCS